MLTIETLEIIDYNLYRYVWNVFIDFVFVFAGSSAFHAWRHGWLVPKFSPNFSGALHLSLYKRNSLVPFFYTVITSAQRIRQEDDCSKNYHQQTRNGFQQMPSRYLAIERSFQFGRDADSLW